MIDALWLIPTVIESTIRQYIYLDSHIYTPQPIFPIRPLEYFIKPRNLNVITVSIHFPHSTLLDYSFLLNKNTIYKRYNGFNPFPPFDYTLLFFIKNTIYKRYNGFKPFFLFGYAGLFI